MKYLKLLSLAAVAAAALMAFVGASAASAETTACKTETLTECYGKGTKVKAVSIGTTDTTKPAGNTHAVLTTPIGEPVECNGTLEGTIETPTTPSGKGTATWANCTNGYEVETLTNGTITIHHDVNHNGTVTIEGFVVKVHSFIGDCYFGGPVQGTLTAGNPAIIHVTQEVKLVNHPLKSNSPFCPTSGNIWHATYEVVEPKPLYINTGV